MILDVSPHNRLEPDFSVFSQGALWGRASWNLQFYRQPTVVIQLSWNLIRWYFISLHNRSGFSDFPPEGAVKRAFWNIEIFSPPTVLIRLSWNLLNLRMILDVRLRLIARCRFLQFHSTGRTFHRLTCNLGDDNRYQSAQSFGGGFLNLSQGVLWGRLLECLSCPLKYSNWFTAYSFYRIELKPGRMILDISLHNPFGTVLSDFSGMGGCGVVPLGMFKLIHSLQFFFQLSWNLVEWW